jgi:hypothetical protein
MSECDRLAETEFRFWDGPGERGTGAVWWIPVRGAPALIGDIYLLDVAGDRVGIQTIHYPDASPGTARELQDIVHSIEFHI